MANSAQSTEPPGNRPLLSVDELRKYFPVSTGLFQRNRSFVHAVDGVSFRLSKGESFGLVGESGCGKTTTGKLLVRLTDPTGGRIIFDDGAGEPTDIATLNRKSLKAFRRKVQMIFQDPYESMNPRLTIFDTIAEPLRVQNMGGPLERLDRATRMLELVGLTPPRTFLFRYPYELSGGQRQRVAIARALIVEPTFVVADEPTSMLDVSIRTSIMRLMQDLASRLGISYLYITHDLAVARYMCSRIAVMYLGKIVEVGETEEILRHPRHPYTKALLVGRAGSRSDGQTPPGQHTRAACQCRWIPRPGADSTIAVPSPTTSAAITPIPRSKTKEPARWPPATKPSTLKGPAGITADAALRLSRYSRESVSRTPTPVRTFSQLIE